MNFISFQTSRVERDLGNDVQLPFINSSKWTRVLEPREVCYKSADSGPQLWKLWLSQSG